ncbi:MAG: hypothetical protein K2H46_07555 [Muribaculaceae bacterium]|nr:hypothetical protein [Muribaculaceae bacterium]
MKETIRASTSLNISITNIFSYRAFENGTPEAYGTMNFGISLRQATVMDKIAKEIY